MGSKWARGAGICRAAAGGLLSVVLLAVDSLPLLAKSPAEGVNGNKTRTRFVIALDRETTFQVSSLSQPNRVVVDLPDVKIGLPAAIGTEPVGLIKGFRGGLAAAGKVKVVIDVTDPVIVEKAHVEVASGGQGPRLVLEIVPVETGRTGAAKAFPTAARIGTVGLGQVQPPLPKRAARPKDRAEKAFRHVIVLDPGHGGHDSGASRYGAVEKNVVLAFSLVLREKLVKTGRYTVLMTRDNDTFVPLDERRDFAERNKAALFMAIHADYAGGSASGGTIYSLRESVARDLKRSAVGEVARNVLSESELQNIKKHETADANDANVVKGFLSDLAQKEVETTSARTSLLTRSVIAFMGESTNMMSNPDRSAAFRVLKTAKVPAVLLELAFVSNRRDAANLQSEAWRNKVADSIVTAIDNYFSHHSVRLPM